MDNQGKYNQSCEQQKDNINEYNQTRGHKFMCEHNRRRSRCKQCGGQDICEHNRRRCRCKQCGGKSICEHNRIRSICKECGGNSICEHSRIRSVCKECGGNSICDHNRIRSTCKECGRKSFCAHNRVRSVCKECRGKSICEHNRVRWVCKECGGKSICEHNRVRSVCKECGSKCICEHNRIHSVCKECGGKSICEHNRRRSECKECGGKYICEHNRIRSVCKQCHGKSICEHNRIRSTCKECGGSRLCITPFCETRKNPKYKPYCFRCFVFMNPDSKIIRNFKTKEIAVRDFILTKFPGLTWLCDKKIPDGCSLRRSDLSLDLGDHMLYVETDEDQHQSGYTCESKRLCELWQDSGQKPTIFIRFNPDAYKTEAGIKVPSCWKKNAIGLHIIKNEIAWNLRLGILETTIAYYITNIPTKSIEIIQLFFSPETKKEVLTLEPSSKRLKLSHTNNK